MLAGGNARVDEYNRLRIIAYDFSTFETDQGLYGGVFDKSTPYANRRHGGRWNVQTVDDWIYI